MIQMQCEDDNDSATAESPEYQFKVRVAIVSLIDVAMQEVHSAKEMFRE
jgi:hypothetical protein